MSKVGGLQFSRPVFDWESNDKLTELSQFKADCEILFTGPLCDLKEKQRAGLLINWLGRQATQIIASSTDNNVDSPEAVFEVLERVFRPESNQTLSRFKFRNMKQTSAQSCDSYMSQLRLSLPECRYRNDSDDLLKDQFIFGLYNKEIQDHLLGEISETDNSVKALYEARKIESKLAQRKMDKYQLHSLGLSLGLRLPGESGLFSGESAIFHVFIHCRTTFCQVTKWLPRRLDLVRPHLKKLLKRIILEVSTHLKVTTL